ncbi:MAG: bacteriocin [Isosphaeraceae bacterium]
MLTSEHNHEELNAALEQADKKGANSEPAPQKKELTDTELASIAGGAPGGFPENGGSNDEAGIMGP